jgi:hypothetical protein
MTKSTSELEREAEATRAQLAATLSELRNRVEPGALADQAFAYARSNGGADFVRNASAQARDNPLPVLLIGAGLAWLMSGRAPSSGPSASAVGDAAMRRTHDVQNAVSDAVGAVSGAASAAMSGLRDAAASGVSGVSQAGARVGDMGAAMGGGLQSGGARAQDAFGRLQAMFADNPVAIGALGVAIGAAIGAALPATETENKLMGEQADDLKAAAKAAAEEHVELGKKAVSAGLDEARQGVGGGSKPS